MMAVLIVVLFMAVGYLLDMKIGSDIKFQKGNTELKVFLRPLEQY